MDKEDIREIDKIIFGVYSAEEIEKFSVCKLNSTKLCTIDKNTTNMNGTVYDPRMGPFDNGIKCATCNLSIVECVGHFGSINFAEPIVHPLFYKHVISFLKCFCTKCYKLLISEDQINLIGFNKLKGIRKFNNILEKLEKIDICSHCNQTKPDVKFTINDSNISLVHKHGTNKISIILQADEIKKIFDNVSAEDVKLLGLDPEFIHPKNLIITVFPVMPHVSRPYVIADGNICDDDLTYQILEIIKVNNHLEEIKGVNNCETKRQKYIQSLKFRVSTYYNNSSSKATHSTNGRAMRGIKERLTGKNGLVRLNLLGKRCEQTGRTVIGGDPTLKMGQVGIPQEIASNLTVPVQVTNYNIKMMQELVNQGKANFVLIDGGKTRIVLGNSYSNALFFRGTILNHGDIIYRKDANGIEGEFVVENGREILKHGDRVKRNGVFLENVEYPEKRQFKINIGDIVERQLMNGDITLVNRQPTLHEGSMFAQEVVILPGKTIRINLAVTKMLNADFDGDEMNLHVPQTVEAQTELRLLSASKYKIISAQGSKPNIAIVQDSLLGAYRMTLGIKKCRKDQFFDISMKLDINSDFVYKKIQQIRRVFKMMGKKAQCFHGKGIISLILPEDFNYEKKNGINPDEPTVKIHKGVLYEGTFDKNILGSVSNSIIQILNKEYGPDVATDFVNGIQFVTNAWLLMTGFSIGLGDCMVSSQTEVEQIEDAVQKCYLEAEVVKTTTTHPGIKEVRILASLNKAKDIGQKIAKDSLSPDNNFLSTIKSGSKGDMFNLTQVLALLGQQNILGQRVKPTLNNGTRTLVHYSKDEKMPMEMEYESRGFVSSNFMKGLNPREFYFHCMSGRLGVVDTSLNTSTSGYIQRKIVKLTEDIKIQYDGTVRDEVGSIYNFTYGENNISPKEMIKVNGNLEPFDIGSIVNKLNSKCKK